MKLFINNYCFLIILIYIVCHINSIPIISPGGNMISKWQTQAILAIILIIPVQILSQDPFFALSPNNFATIIDKHGTLVGQVAVVELPEPAIDLTGNSHIIINNFSFPQSGFSIESQYYLTGYADRDPYISCIGASWHDGTNTEGVSFRVGGGYLYPLLPNEAYDGLDDYVHPGVNRYTRAKLSKCIGDFVLGTGKRPWKEVFSDCCLPLNEWVHMVATWDGEEARIFVNGRDATDGWRSSGIDLPAFYKETTNLYIGTDNHGNVRDLNGYLGFFNVYDKVLSLKEIREKYRASLPEESCRIIIGITSPRSGELILPSTKLTFSVSMEGNCEKEDFNKEEYTIEFSNDPGFSTILYSTKVNIKDIALTDVQSGISQIFGSVMLSDVLSGISQNFESAMFIRISPQSSLTRRSYAQVGITSLAVPVLYDPKISTKLKNTPQIASQAIKYAGYNLFDEQSVEVYDFCGRRIKHIGQIRSTSSTGIYIVKSQHSSKTFIRFKH